MRSYLSGLRINITLIFMSSSSYLVHVISCRRINAKISLFVMFIIFFLFLVSTFYFYYWAACAPSHKMGFRSSVSKSGLPGEGRHEGLVPRNDVLTNGFIWVSLARTLARILFVPRLRSPWKTHKALRTWRRLFALFEAIRSWESLYNFFIVRV